MPSDIHQFNESSAGAFAAIYQGVRDFRKELAKTKSPNELKKSSIMRAQKDLVMSFPVLCTDTISPDIAMLLCKAIERNAVTALQQLFTASHIQGTNGVDVLGQFHKNMDNQLDISDYMDYAAAAVRNANNYKVGGSAVRAADSFFRMGSYGESAKAAFLEQSKEFYPVSSFSEKSLSDYLVTESYEGYDVREFNGTYLHEADTKKSLPPDLARGIRKANDDVSKSGKGKSAAEMELQAALGNASNNLSAAKNQIEREKLLHQIDNDMQNARHNYITKQLLPTDVQKINELVPSLMIVRFYVDDDKAVESVQEFVAGVKARFIPVPSEEVTEKIGNYKKGGINQFELARATTKEISFAKDFVSAIKDAKLDAMNDSLSQTSPVWRSLQARSSSSTARRLVHGRNTAAAITTLIITQQEVDYIKTNYRVSIDTVNEAVNFMAKFNLMGLVIANEQTEVARFILDGDRYFTNYTFTSLDRQAKNMDYQIANIIAKNNR